MKREQTWDELERFLQTFTYEDGSHARLIRDDDSNYAVLHLVVHAPNSYHGTPGDRPVRYTRHERVVPVATYNYQTWRRWVYEFCKDIAVHEVGEWFQDDGERIFAPHHGNGEDPYVEWSTRPDRHEQTLKSPGDD